MQVSISKFYTSSDKTEEDQGIKEEEEVIFNNKDNNHNDNNNNDNNYNYNKNNKNNNYNINDN